MSADTRLSYRVATVGRDTVDTRARTAKLSFSSEAPIRRWMGDEILLHGPGNADLTRMTTVGAVLYGHHAGDMDAIIGRVVTARIDTARRRGVATIQFDDDAPGAKALAKVNSGSLRGVSFGYAIKEAVRVEEGEAWTDPETGKVYPGPALIATKWEAYEISLTPVPADPSVGVGRDLTRSRDGIKIRSAKEALKMRKNTLTSEILQEIVARAAAVGPEVKALVVDMADRGATAEQLFRAVLDAMGARGNALGPVQPQVRKFSEIDDDVLARSFMFPQSYGHGLATADRKQPTAAPVRRLGLPKLSELDDDALANLIKRPVIIYD
jgi:HK97 family phage prohead protease